MKICHFIRPSIRVFLLIASCCSFLTDADALPPYGAPSTPPGPETIYYKCEIISFRAVGSGDTGWEKRDAWQSSPTYFALDRPNNNLYIYDKDSVRFNEFSNDQATLTGDSVEIKIGKNYRAINLLTLDYTSNSELFENRGKCSDATSDIASFLEQEAARKAQERQQEAAQREAENARKAKEAAQKAFDETPAGICTQRCDLVAKACIAGCGNPNIGTYDAQCANVCLANSQICGFDCKHPKQ